MTDLVARHVDLARHRRRGGQPSRPTSRGTRPSQRPAAASVTVALAAGKAFSFGYTEHGELLRAAGADVVEFDPLTDPLPRSTAALVLPGGFPEQFSTELSANDVVRQQINALAASGAPIHAECAGLTYLVDDLDGYPMCGVLSGSARFTDRLTLGYRDAVAVADSPLHTVGDRVVGHEFHRTTVTFADSYPARVGVPRAGRADRRGRRRARRRARGYLHTHPAAHPQAITRFVAAAATSKLAG